MKLTALSRGLTKHERIIRYIRGLEINTKISVRQIAKELNVSEGTAYRAIKEAEAQGLVSSIPKVGTIRIESEKEREIQDFTFREISYIVEGEVLAGHQLLEQTPDHFLIGCNKPDGFQRHPEKNQLLIVGDLPEYQRMALENNFHLMVTGAFQVSPDLIQLAEEKGLLIISCPYDAFEAVSLLNRAVYERLTEKELIRVENIMVKDPLYLGADATVEDWYRLAQSTNHSRFPVVDQNKKVVGIVTAVDVAGAERGASIISVMTKDPFAAEKKTLVTHLSRSLLWEGFELVPIVEEDGRLVGVVSQQDILKAFQQTQKNPIAGETVDNLVMSGFTLDPCEQGTKVSGRISKFMINEHGAASPGVLVMIISTTAYIDARRHLKVETVVENMAVQHMEPLAVGERVEAFSRLVHVEKKSAVADVSVYAEGKLKAKSLVSMRIIKKNRLNGSSIRESGRRARKPGQRNR